ncbi:MULTISPECIES: DUF2000 domain-containing protein [Streptacidiphilus]|uniref:DUF2000 domain-containing protein n=1 Tax=Streptacidiphilus cavernicola TaxID=3342716 RepID=A0ABV6UZY1_9ACTN|nr:DUF2000 domain-containing protein [Streptacidiphilus jeojiense]
MSTPQLSSEDIRTDLSTRKAKLKWVIVVDQSLAAGRLVNAAACMAAAVGKALPDLVGRDGDDASGVPHPGLPWAGCSILAADADTLGTLRTEAVAKGDEVLIVDMPDLAQTSRVYDEYLDQLAGSKTEDLTYCAISLVGPRNKIDKLVRRLPLLR